MGEWRNGGTEEWRVVERPVLDGCCWRAVRMHAGGAGMAVRLDDEAPDVAGQTTEGEIRFHDRQAGNRAVLAIHPNASGVATTKPCLRVTRQPDRWRRSEAGARAWWQ